MPWKTTSLALKIWPFKAGGLWWQVQVHLNVGPSARNMWYFKTGGLSWQWSFKTGFTVSEYLQFLPAMPVPEVSFILTVPPHSAHWWHIHTLQLQQYTLSFSLWTWQLKHTTELCTGGSEKICNTFTAQYDWLMGALRLRVVGFRMKWTIHIAIMWCKILPTLWSVSNLWLCHFVVNLHTIKQPILKIEISSKNGQMDPYNDFS